MTEKTSGEAPFDRVFVWRNNPRRAELYGRACRVVARGSTRHSVLLEFEDGARVVTSARSVRKADRPAAVKARKARGDNV